MKKNLTILLLAILLVWGLFILTCCGNTTDNQSQNESQNQSQNTSGVEGTYKGLYTKFVGDPETSKVEDEAFSLELKGDGTGTHNRDDSSFKVTWSLEGNKFSMKETFLGAAIDYTGTLENGKLDIFNGEESEDLTCEYVYEKQQ